MRKSAVVGQTGEPGKGGGRMCGGLAFGFSGAEFGEGTGGRGVSGSSVADTGGADAFEVSGDASLKRVSQTRLSYCEAISLVCMPLLQYDTVVSISNFKHNIILCCISCFLNKILYCLVTHKL